MDCNLGGIEVICRAFCIIVEESSTSIDLAVDDQENGIVGHIGSHIINRPGVGGCEVTIDPSLSLYDDPTIDFAPRSRPCDDEGMPSQKVALIEKGVVKNFLYDLQTAGQANTSSTSSGARGRGGLMMPSASALVFSTGHISFEEMLRNTREGLLVEQLMGAEQGNVLGGDFSGNVLLGYKIENGQIVGRVKNTMVSGNVYQILKEVTLGNQARWVSGAVFTPHIYCANVAVASK